LGIDFGKLLLEAGNQDDISSRCSFGVFLQFRVQLITMDVIISKTLQLLDGWLLRKGIFVKFGVHAAYFPLIPSFSPKGEGVKAEQSPLVREIKMIPLSPMGRGMG
jgi:hypothetical protein